MPNKDGLEGGLHQGNQQWNQALTHNTTHGVPESHQTRSIELEDPEEKEAARRRREAANGYYFESSKPFCPQAHLEVNKYTITPGRTSVAPISPKAISNSTPSRRGSTSEINQQIGHTVDVKPINEAEVMDATGELDESLMEPPVPREEDHIEEAIDTVVNTKPTTPVEIQKVENSLQVLTSHVDRLYAQYEAELSKGDAADMDKVTELAMRMFTIWQRLSARHDEDLSLDMTNQLHTHVQRVKDTYNGNIGSIIFTVASSILSVLGGLGQMVGGGVQMVGGTRLITVDKAKNIMKLAQGASGIGSGVGMPGKLFDESSAGQRTVLQHRQTEHQRKRDDKTQKAQQNDARSRDTLRSLQEHNNQVTRKKNTMMGAAE